MATIEVAPDSHDALEIEVRALTVALERERARNAGLERGVSALSERVDALRLENLELRRRLEHAA